MNKEKTQSPIFKIITAFLISLFALLIVLIGLKLVAQRLSARHPFKQLADDYVELIGSKVGPISSKFFKIRKHDVNIYQLKLVKQSVNDYLNVIRKQQNELTSVEAVRSVPADEFSESDIESIKKKFFRMNLENPYLKSLTFFDMSGKMLMNVYSHKGWNIKLREELIEEIKTKGRLVLHSDTENVLYCLNYYNFDGHEMILSTRTDKSFIKDIVAYYQLADKTFFIRDDHNISYIIDSAKQYNSTDGEELISLLAKYAKYKTTASINDIGGVAGLSISMVGRTYTDSFALLVLALTAFTGALIFAMIYFTFKVFRSIIGEATDTFDDVEEPEEERGFVYDEEQHPAIELSSEPIMLEDRNSFSVESDEVTVEQPEETQQKEDEYVDEYEIGQERAEQGDFEEVKIEQEAEEEPKLEANSADYQRSPEDIEVDTISGDEAEEAVEIYEPLVEEEEPFDVEEDDESVIEDEDAEILAISAAADEIVIEDDELADTFAFDEARLVEDADAEDKPSVVLPADEALNAEEKARKQKLNALTDVTALESASANKSPQESKERMSRTGSERRASVVNASDKTRSDYKADIDAIFARFDKSIADMVEESAKKRGKRFSSFMKEKQSNLANN